MSITVNIMNFNKFVNVFKNSVLIESSAFEHYGKPADLRRQVLRWVSKKYLYPLKRGVYILNEEFRKNIPSLPFVANQLLSPSYVSLEYALGYYGLIPEKVTVITSVTTKTTLHFTNILGRFEYKSISKALFWGMAQNAEEEQKYFIAEPEKALLDFLYFAYDAKPVSGYFEAMRFQNLDKLDKKTLESYARKYNRRVQKLAAALLDYAKNVRKEFKEL